MNEPRNRHTTIAEVRADLEKWIGEDEDSTAETKEKCVSIIRQNFTSVEEDKWLSVVH